MKLQLGDLFKLGINGEDLMTFSEGGARNNNAPCQGRPRFLVYMGVEVGIALREFQTKALSFLV